MAYANAFSAAATVQKPDEVVFSNENGLLRKNFIGSFISLLRLFQTSSVFFRTVLKHKETSPDFQTCRGAE